MLVSQPQKLNTGNIQHQKQRTMRVGDSKLLPLTHLNYIILL